MNNNEKFPQDIPASEIHDDRLDTVSGGTETDINHNRYIDPTPAQSDTAPVVQPLPLRSHSKLDEDKIADIAGRL